MDSIAEADRFPARDGRGGRRALGLRVVALLETLAFLGLALAVDGLLGAGDRFAGISPHPFWIVVLLVATQYGTGDGLAAAALASAALLAGNMPEQGFNEELYAWLLTTTAEPLLWFITAVVLGEIRDARHRESASLREELREGRAREAAIGEAYAQLSELKDVLETRVAGQTRTVQSVYAASRAVERLDTAEVLVGIHKLVSSVLGPEKFSLYLVDGGALRAAACEGWREGEEFTAEFGPSSLLFQAIVRSRRTLVATDPDDGLLLGAEGLLAAPLVNTETGTVIGMLKIEAIKFLDLNPACIHDFHVVREWISAAFTNAWRFEETQAWQHPDRPTRTMPQALFEPNRAAMRAMAQRFGFDLATIFVGIDLPERIDPAARDAVAQTVALVADRLLEPTDFCFAWKRDGWDLAFLLPGSGINTAAAFGVRFSAELEAELAAEGHAAQVRHAVEPPHPRERGFMLIESSAP